MIGTNAAVIGPVTRALHEYILSLSFTKLGGVVFQLELLIRSSEVLNLKVD